MHSRCLPWLPDNTWSLQRWVQESKKKKNHNCFSVSKNPTTINWNEKKKERQMCLHWLCSRTDRLITYCFSYRFMSFVLFLVSACLWSLPVLLVYRMNNEGMEELISPWKAASSYWEERYIEKNCSDDFSSKLFYNSNPQLWGCVVISVAIALKDNDIHPWPKGSWGLLYCTFPSVCVHRFLWGNYWRLSMH